MYHLDHYTDTSILFDGNHAFTLHTKWFINCKISFTNNKKPIQKKVYEYWAKWQKNQKISMNSVTFIASGKLIICNHICERFWLCFSRKLHGVLEHWLYSFDKCSYFKSSNSYSISCKLWSRCNLSLGFSWHFAV